MRDQATEQVDYEVTGWRYADKSYLPAPTVGDKLANSYAWDGDEITDEELAGACAFATREACEKYAKHSRGGGWLVEIGGKRAGAGGDMIDEIVVGDAVVLSIEAW